MKRSLDDLAIFGGSPCFDELLHVGRPNIGDRQILLRRINDLLDRRWLSNNGPFVQEFESRIVEMTGVKHCIATCNGTVALEIAIRAAGLQGEVLVPSFTFIATAHALQWQGITPVFCDVDQWTHNIDPSRVEQMITPRTTGMIGVHVWGRPCDVGALTEIARRRNLRILFDAAHALGSSHRGRAIGNFGDAEVFSFHATKFVNAFEGGAVVTNDDELATKVRLMTNFGFSGYDQVSCIGTNGKMTEVSAAMGLTSLEALDSIVTTNRRHYEQFRRELENIPGISLLSYNEQEACNYQYIVAEIDEFSTALTRDQLQEILWAENILARRYFYPGCHRMEPYRSQFPHSGILLPDTERLAATVLVLPTGATLTSNDISTICGIVRFAVAHGPETAARLARCPYSAGKEITLAREHLTAI
jgi:dTDP-4-amino-4,6-dideoxygalactose transaminase